MKKLFSTFLFFCQFAFVHAQEEESSGYMNSL